ncbi:GAF domain-containing protein [Escherichia coli]
MPSVKEERFRAFLGVPIIQRRQLLGVLVVQQRELRQYDESEESFWRCLPPRWQLFFLSRS